MCRTLILGSVVLALLTSTVDADEASDLSDAGEVAELREELGTALQRIDALEDALSQPAVEPWTAPYYVDYDKGLVLRPVDKNATPFELKVGVRMQYRYSGFTRDRQTFSNQGDMDRGGPLPVGNRSDFEIERGRIIFRGFMFDPKLGYFVNLNADTDDNHRVSLFDFWVYYEFDKAFILNIGKAMVPGSRDWLSLSPNTHIADRSMATTFFRPDRTIGVWARGELCDGLHYHAMLGNGFNTADRAPQDVDNRFVYAMTSWWEPLGPVGKSHADLKWHENAVVRLGHSFTYSSQAGDDDGTSNPEESFVRLSDGTRLITPGALAPGVSVSAFDIYLYTIDAAFKHQGFSMNAEFFLRWLNRFETTAGAVPNNELFDKGFYVDAGYFLVPQKLEVAGVVSHVSGLFGDSWEYAAGINYFLKPTQVNKLTFDVSVLDGSPVSNSGTNHFVGADGVMFRCQYQVQY